MNYLTVKQRQDLAKIANSYPNLQCVQCAFAIKNYLQLVEFVFDNHHPEGMPKREWLANFQFFGKIHLGQELVIIEENF